MSTLVATLPALSCPGAGHVFLVGTKEQMDRLATNGWANCVQAEFSRQHPVAVESATLADLSVLEENTNTPDAPVPEVITISDGEEDEDDAVDGDTGEQAVLPEDPGPNIIPSVDGEEGYESMLGLDAVMTSLQTTGTAQDEINMWAQACQFFCCDTTVKDSELYIPGVSLPLFRYQILDVYRMLNAVRSDTFTGTFNASKPGLGKTLESVAAIACICLARMSREHVRDHQSLHTYQEDCPHNGDFGIACGCCPTSLTRKLVHGLPRSPQLIVVPPAVVSQWEKQLADDLRTPTTVVNGQQRLAEPLFTAYTLSRQQGFSTCQPSLPNDRPPPSYEDLLYSASIDPLRSLPLPTGQDAKDHPLFHYNKTRPSPSKQPPVIFKADLGLSIDGLHAFAKKEHPAVKVSVSRSRTLNERTVILCSTSFISQAQFPHLFHTVIEMQQGNKRDMVRVALTGLVRFSHIVYDEWHKAKSADSNTVKNIVALCSNPRVRDTRTLMSLLSATPMTLGPADFDGILPAMVRTPGGHATILQDLKRQHGRAHTALKTEPNDESARRVAISAAVSAWHHALAHALGPCLITRDYGQLFLGDPIPDLRPPLHRQPIKHADLLPQHRDAIVKLMEKLRTWLADTSKQRENMPVDTLQYSKAYQNLLRYSVVPSLAVLAKNRIRRPKDKRPSLQPDFIEENAEHLHCNQFQLLQDIVERRRDACRPSNYLVLTLFPDNAIAAHVYLSRHASGSVKSSRLISTETPTSLRESFLADFAASARAEEEKGGEGKNSVLISTYGVAATGLDGLQNNIADLVKLGDPFAPTTEYQAIGRIYRYPQGKVVHVHAIHGEKGSLDDLLRQSNLTRFPLVNLGTMLEQLKMPGGAEAQ